MGHRPPEATRMPVIVEDIGKPRPQMRQDCQGVHGLCEVAQRETCPTPRTVLKGFVELLIFIDINVLKARNRAPYPSTMQSCEYVRPVPPSCHSVSLRFWGEHYRGHNNSSKQH